jgi:hypothetical protein
MKYLNADKLNLMNAVLVHRFPSTRSRNEGLQYDIWLFKNTLDLGILKSFIIIKF